MSKMEFLDPKETEKFKKQKRVQFCRTPCIYVVLTAFRCLNKQVEEDALDVVIDDEEGNLGLKAFAVGTVGNGALYRIVCTSGPTPCGH